MAVKVHPRIYEKTMLHHDFLMYRVGLGTVDSSFEIELNTEEFTLDKDELMDKAKTLRSQYLTLDHVPVVTSLMNGPVGYIGQRPLVWNSYKCWSCRLLYFTVIMICSLSRFFQKRKKGKWAWMRWLPHASLRDINVRGFVYHERSRDQVLTPCINFKRTKTPLSNEKGNKK